MDFKNFISPDRTTGLEGAALGAVIRLMIYGKLDWRLSIGVSACAVVCSYYFAAPGARIVSSDPNMIGPAGFLIGLVALQACTGIVNLATAFQIKPASFLQYLPWVGGKWRKDDE